jgi:hypothetical protein
MSNDDLIAGLRTRRNELAAELDALDGAIAALSGGLPKLSATATLLRSTGYVGVGAGKLAVVRKYIYDRGKVRQADITHDTGYNAGTITMATRALERAGEIVRGSKEDRSTTWSAVH